MSHKTTRRRHYGRRRSGNPLGLSSDLIPIFILGTAGAIGSRALPSLLLGAKDTGAIGYLADGAAAIALGAVSNAVKAGTGEKVTAGGLIALGLRIMGDYMPSMPGMSGYVNANFPLPTTSNSRVFGALPPVSNPGGNVGMRSVVPTGMGRAFARRRA